MVIDQGELLYGLIDSEEGCTEQRTLLIAVRLVNCISVKAVVAGLLRKLLRPYFQDVCMCGNCCETSYGHIVENFPVLRAFRDAEQSAG
jgi:hypothetical protein